MIRLPRACVDQIVEHARRESPRECCGILAGRGDRVERVYRVTNREPGTARYFMDPEEQYRVMRDIDSAGLELLGTYHSHPATPAYPSPTDVSLAFYPEAVYLICSLAGAKPPELRAFRIVDERIEEVPVTIGE